MADLSSDKQRILSYLESQLADGKQYLRSSDIAENLGLTSKQVGTHLGHLENTETSLSISQWGHHRSTTWCIETSNS